MPGHRSSSTELAQLRARIDHLEQSDRWHRFAIDLLISMRDADDGSLRGRNPAVILVHTRDTLRRLHDWRTLAFFTISEQDASFVLHDCDPPADWDWVQRESARRIASGEFAWALNQNRHVIMSAQEDARPLIWHVLATRNRIRGMFLGVPSQAPDQLPESALHLLSLILSQTAHALESAELYRLLHEEKQLLETHLKARTAELHYRYTHDELTGLPNRILLLDRLGQAIRHGGRLGHRVGVLVLDVDAFKLINDSLGRAAGDRLLRLLSERLQRQLVAAAPPDRTEWSNDLTVARLGGDEFCVLLPNIQRIEDAMAAIERLRALVAEPFDLDGQRFHATCGIGISLFPDDHRVAEMLLSQALAAMHHAKVEGRNRHQFYRPQINDRARFRVTMTMALRQALEQQAFVLHYQPQIRIQGAEDRIVGCEALLRWRRADGTLVPPCEFIPLLEEHGELMIAVGDWILGEAAAALRRLHDAGQPRLRMAVNLSAVQFEDPGLSQRIRAILEDVGLPPAALELEITESTLTRDLDQAVTTLRTLHALGVRVAIDDFGTGYSSLSYLKRFPLSTLKVDRSFIQELPHDEEDTAIVQTILALARALNLEVVAEGVEHADQVMLLRRLGCDLIQGFHYSRPLEEARLLDYLASGP